MSVHLRPITRSNLLDPVIRSLIGSLPTFEMLAEIDQTGGVLRIIEMEGIVVGVASVMPNGELMVAVDKAQRRKGIASSAVRKIATIAFQEVGISKITFSTQIGSASASLADKMGASEIGRSGSEIFFEVTREQWQSLTSS